MRFSKKLGAVLLIGLSQLMLVSCNEAKETEKNTTVNENADNNQGEMTNGKQENVNQDITEAKSESLVFSRAAGVYGEAFDLSISALKNGEIYYTVDGSDPAISDTAVLHENSIKITDRKGDANVVSAVDTVLISGNFNNVNSKRDGFTCKIKSPSDDAVDKCTVVRAVVKLEDGSFSEEMAATYFIGTPEEHIQGLAESCEAAGQDLAVISISVNYDDFFSSDKGIYVKGDVFANALTDYINSGEKLREGEDARSLDANYKQKGREWERVANMTMFEFSTDGAVQVLNQTCGVRIQGNYSRSDLQKGLRLYARDDYGDNNFRYAVFGEDYLNDAGEVMNKFKTLTLRNGGNCAFAAKFNDIFWQSLVGDTACATKESRPCVVYLNGEYWGLYVLEEDYTDDYFEDVHGVNKDDVVIYKGDAESLEIGYKLDEGEIPEGEDEKYYFKDLLDFFASHDNLEKQEDYDEFVKLVDPNSVMDYFAVQSWINNKWDWPGKNWSMWKTINVDESNAYADGRWRLIFYDMEFGGVSGASDARTNTIKEDNYKPNGLLDMGTDNPAVLCFAYLMTNDDFANAFYERLSGLSEGMLEKEAALARLKEFEDIYGPLYTQFFARYPGTGSRTEALDGGYASAKCIEQFLNQRANHIQTMIDYCKRVLK